MSKRVRIPKLDKREFQTSKRPAGLSRSKKIISTEKVMEAQFMELCKLIDREEQQTDRREQQKLDRKAKRQKVPLD